MNTSLENLGEFDLREHTVLIIDDEPANLGVMSDYLGSFGLGVLIARDGKSGLERAQYAQPDLILLDVLMPGMDGFETCRRLKADEMTGDIPVIFMTALAGTADKAKGFQLGAVDYVTKPFQHEEVLARVTTHLRVRDLTRQIEEVKARTAALTQANQELQAEITGRIRTEAALRASEEKYRRIVDTAAEGIWAFGPDTRTTLVNTRMTETLGYSAAEMIGQPMTDFMLEEDVPDHLRRMEARRKGASENYELRLRSKDGRTIWTFISATGMFDDEHNFQGSFGMISDITERKQEQGKLAEERALLRCLIDSVSDLIFIKDRNGVYQGCNKAGEAFVGMPESEQIGKSDFDFFDREKAEEIQKADRQVLEEGKPLHIEEWVTGQDGRCLLMDTLKAPYYAPDGEILGLVGIGRDVTERKRAELALRESEEKYRLVFENSPVSIWEQDFSGVKNLFDDLKEEGVTDIGTYFAQHPKTVRQCADLVKIVDVNQVALALHGAANKEELLAGLVNIFTPESFDTFRYELISLWKGETGIIRDAVVRTLAGEPRNVTINLSVCPGYEETLSKVLVSLIDITERKRAEQGITLMNFALDNVHEAAFLADENPRLHYVNEEACRVLGYTREELLGLSAAEVNPDHTVERWSSLWDELKTRQSLSYEGHHKTKDGRLIPVEINANYFEYEGQGYNLTLVRDITERKQAEQERLAHLRFLESMDQINRAIQGTNDLEQTMNNVLDIILSILDCDRVYLVHPCDPDASSWFPLTESTRPEYPGILALGLGEIPIDADTAKTFQLLLDTDGPVKLGQGNTHPLPHDISERFDIKSIIAMALYPKMGKPWQFGIQQCSYERIWTPEDEKLLLETGRRLTDALTSLLTYQELQQSEEQLRLTLEAAQIGIWDWDILHDRWDASPTYYTMLGYDPKHGFGERGEWLERLHPDDRDMVHAKIQRVLARDFQEYHYEARMRHADGAYRWVSVVGFEIQRDQDGQVTRMLGIRMDITERKRAEEELRAHHDHLEELVRERTTELVVAKDAAEEARRSAEAASQAKSAFLAQMSHELRTPLNAILGYAQILQRRPLDADVINALNTIQRSGEHLLTLINDILDIARIEAGRLELFPTPIHLPGFLDHVASIIRSRAQAKGLAFTFEKLGAIPVGVQADETRLRQVLLNLLDNAVKFTDQGEVVLSVEVCEYESEAPSHPHTPSLRFSVRDTGIGIPPDQLERIFQPFEQVRDVTRPIKGTGLGLAISHQLVHLMGGDLQVESPPSVSPTLRLRSGQAEGEVKGRPGSIFWFEIALPVIEMALEDVQSPERTITGYRGPRRTVLVVDDVPSSRAILVDLLQPLGFEVVEAADGQQALHLAQELRPDLILMDRWMPGLDGFEAAQRMRQIPELREASIVTVSASVSQEDQEQSREVGIDAFLPKPVSWPRLATLLQECLALEWEYEKTIEVGEREGEAILVPPPAEEMEILLDLARRGNMRAIQEQAAHIETLGEQYVPFARTLRELAKGFEERQILALVERYMEKDQ